MRNTKGLESAAILSLILVSLSSLAGAQESYVPPQLSFGVPDLQGIWSYETRTSLERPDHYADLEIDEAAMLDTLEPTDQILDDY